MIICFHDIGHTQQQPSQVGSLFTFLARQGARYRTSIRVDEHVYDQVWTRIPTPFESQLCKCVIMRT